MQCGLQPGQLEFLHEETEAEVVTQQGKLQQLAALGRAYSRGGTALHYTHTSHR